MLQRALSTTVVTLLLVSIALAANASLETVNGTSFSRFIFDRTNGTQGSDSYMDDSPVNPDVYLRICHENLTVGQRVDIVYSSYSGNTTATLLRYRPQIASIINGTNCSRVNLDLSSADAVYPGYIRAILNGSNTSTITVGNGSNATNVTTTTNYSYRFDELNQSLNGSYEMTVSVQGPPKIYYLSVIEVLDNNNLSINLSLPKLVISLVNEENETLVEGLRSPFQSVSYTGNFVGGERVFVNGIVSLEAKVYTPCEPINESGYYIFNESSFNRNASCVVVNQTDNLVLNFATELIDGDSNVNGSLRNTSCAVVIENSRNVTLENLRTQDFYYGVCIRNSSVTVFSNNTVANKVGALVTRGSTASFVDVLFTNEDTEILSEQGSRIELLRTNISTAKIKGTFYDLAIKAVPSPPADPLLDTGNGTGERLYNISQWAEFSKSSTNAWGELSFHYVNPLPNSVIIDNVSIYRYNGTKTLISGNGSNGSVYNWSGGNWTKEFTLVSPSEFLIIGPNSTNFSMWAPYGFQGQPLEEPEPDPDPTPRAGDSSGGGGGGGGGAGPENIELEPGDEDETATLARVLELELQIPDNITLMQGEAGLVPFNVTNRGQISGKNVTIEPTVRLGWEFAPYEIANIEPGETVNGTFRIAPFERAIPRVYPVPVSAVLRSQNRSYPVTREIMTVIVTPRGNLSRLRVLEYPPVVEMEPNSILDIAFLAENIGDNYLSGLTARYISDEECIVDIQGSYDLAAGQNQLLVYSFESAGVGACRATIEFVSNEEMVGFVPIEFVIRPSEEGLTRGERLFILVTILGLWTLLTAYIVRRRRNQ